MTPLSEGAGIRTAKPDEHPTSLSLDPFACIPTAAIRAAAVRVSERWSSDGEEIVAAQDVTFELLELCRGIEKPGTNPLRVDADSTTLVLRNRLLRELRREILQQWNSNGPPSTIEMLRVLSGLDHAQALIEPASIDIMAKRLSDAGGLDLVVEVAHDLRSPLTSILFLSDSMLREQSGRLNGVQKQQLGIIDAAALRLVNMASDVIELARGRDDFKPGSDLPFSLTEILDPVRDLVEPMAQQKGLTLMVTLIASDKRRGLPVPLARVLLNLATNALSFAHQHVEITASDAGPASVEFSIRDDGSGIEPDDMRTLFHPFRRAGHNRPGYQFSGTGLALNICRKLVRSMGGELQIETAPGWGTRFFFELELPVVRDA